MRVGHELPTERRMNFGIFEKSFDRRPETPICHAGWRIEREPERAIKVPHAHRERLTDKMIRPDHLRGAVLVTK